jgi:hypothetical protein
MAEKYRILLVDLGADTPAAVRLRSALKRLLRTYRLRCTEAVEVAEDAAGGGAEKRPGDAGGTGEHGR